MKEKIIIDPVIIGAIIGVAGVIIGWLLNFLTDLIKEKIKKGKILKSLLSELQFNQGTVSYRYLYFADLFKDTVPNTFSKEDKDILLNLPIKLALMKELGWGFKVSAYNKAELEGALIDLPTYGEIMDIYRTISLLQNYGVPKDKVGWIGVREKLEGLQKSLKLVSENFYKNKREWITVIREELKKSEKR